MRVLIVDDEKIICEGLCAMIPWANFGFLNPDTTSNGAKALQMLKETAYDLLITDIRMPTMDGLTLCRHVHTQYPDCAIIIMSGYSDFEYAQQAIEYGVRCYLLKPVDENKLMAHLEKLRQSKELEKTHVPVFHSPFYENELPFNGDDCQLMPSVSVAGKTLARRIAKGDVDSAKQLLKNFIWKMQAGKPDSDGLFSSCEDFLSPLLQMAETLKISDPLLREWREPGGRIYIRYTATLASLYDSLDAAVTRISGQVNVLMSEGTVRTSDQMAAFIRENYSDKMSAAGVANHFHLSPAYCGRLFKEEQGISIIRYIHMVRIERAKELLTQTDFKIEYIAMQIGYPEVSNFYLQFKRLVDMTPEQYRKLTCKTRNEEAT